MFINSFLFISYIYYIIFLHINQDADGRLS
nr:MAG TPA: hypothetical protein [Caudoviricetes sp.]